VVVKPGSVVFLETVGKI